VNVVAEWPSRSLTVFAGSPALKAMLALVCRR
jgi:hypothetical protein